MPETTTHNSAPSAPLHYRETLRQLLAEGIIVDLEMKERLKLLDSQPPA